MSSKKVKNLEKNISEVLAQILEIKQMARGSYGTVFLTCGKQTCRCITQGQKHTQTRITWSEGGKTINRTTPPEDADWLTEITDEYRRYTKLKKRLVKLQNDLLNELESRASNILEKTKKRRSYLNVNKG